MQVMRVPPYPLTTVWNLPDANYGYIVYVEDLVDHSIEETVIYSDANGIIEYVLPLSKVEFDREFLIRFYDAEHEHILLEDSLTVVRPYVNPASLSSSPSEIAEYQTYEVIARSLIDTYINDGFYNHKSILQSQGNGLDYMPVWRMANRVLKVYENNVLIFNGQDTKIPALHFYDQSLTPDTEIGLTGYSTHGFVVGDNVVVNLTAFGIADQTFKVSQIIDAYSFRINAKYSSIDTSISYTTGHLGNFQRIWPYGFSITLDNSAVQKVANSLYDRLSSTNPNLTLPISRGDTMFYERPTGGAFRTGYDYLFVFDEGFRAIPPDIENATLMLINDLKHGKLDYYQRGVSSYDTDQFKMQLDKNLLQGTGNIVVDRMLDKYIRGTLKIGVI